MELISKKTKVFGWLNFSIYSFLYFAFLIFAILMLLNSEAVNEYYSNIPNNQGIGWFLLIIYIYLIIIGIPILIVSGIFYILNWIFFKKTLNGRISKPFMIIKLINAIVGIILVIVFVFLIENENKLPFAIISSIIIIGYLCSIFYALSALDDRKVILEEIIQTSYRK